MATAATHSVRAWRTLHQMQQLPPRGFWATQAQRRRGVWWFRLSLMPGVGPATIATMARAGWIVGDDGWWRVTEGGDDAVA
jgi:hypothetical protein